MAKAKKKHSYADYPKHDAMRVGIKVSWYYYKDQAMAEKAAEAAKINAAIQASLGYDFGYQSPGSITQCNADYWPTHDGMFEVCIP